ncbi:MAG: hypothetical protein Q9M40_02335 [Sulfurimonas sp.]|nr:hypothetical protein [Sulfurimonas sp.]
MKFIKSLFITSLLVLSLHAREQVNVNFSDLQISDFIKLISKITHKNILVTNKINGTVNFISTTPVYDDELIDILISVLESKGHTLIKKGSLYEIVRSTEAAKFNVEVISSKSKSSWFSYGHAGDTCKWMKMLILLLCKNPAILSLKQQN